MTYVNLARVLTYVNYDRAVMAEDDDLIGTSDIADMLGVSRQRVGKLFLDGRLPDPVGRLRNARIWRRSDVEAWMKEQGRAR